MQARRHLADARPRIEQLDGLSIPIPRLRPGTPHRPRQPPPHPLHAPQHVAARIGRILPLDVLRRRVHKRTRKTCPARNVGPLTVHNGPRPRILEPPVVQRRRAQRQRQPIGFPLGLADVLRPLNRIDRTRPPLVCGYASATIRVAGWHVLSLLPAGVVRENPHSHGQRARALEKLQPEAGQPARPARTPAASRLPELGDHHAGDIHARTRLGVPAVRTSAPAGARRPIAAGGAWVELGGGRPPGCGQPPAADVRARTLYESPHLTVTGASAKHLLAMKKLLAGRPKDRADVAALSEHLGLKGPEEAIRIYKELQAR